MAKIKCQLISQPTTLHAQQIKTGYFMLFKRGLIDFSVVLRSQSTIDKTRFNHSQDAVAGISVILNNEVKLYYDVQDGFGVNAEILNDCDFYFKRSYYPAYIDNLKENKEKVFPLGLNYLLYPNVIDKFAFQISLFSSYGLRKKLINILNAVDSFNVFQFRPRVRHMEALPDVDVTPKVLFIVKAYDPYEKQSNSLEYEERIANNETRAKCVELLRKEFGDNFYGGFNHSKYAAENFKSCLLPDNRLYRKDKYFELLKSYPICVTTTGLHGSIGWKFAEYVALSKAILSEKIKYQAKGDLKEGSNYIGFRTPEECVDAAVKLFTNRDLRCNLMANNAMYYQAYLRPDALILNSILTALAYN